MCFVCGVLASLWPAASSDWRWRGVSELFAAAHSSELRASNKLQAGPKRPCVWLSQQRPKLDFSNNNNSLMQSQSRLHKSDET